MNESIITVVGNIATDPRHLVTGEGLAVTSFRLGSNTRRWDRAAGKHVEGETNWFTVSAFRGLAENAGACLKKGDRVLVTGRLRIRPWDKSDRAGITAEVDADAIGHDLTWGTSTFTPRATPARADTGEQGGNDSGVDVPDSAPPWHGDSPNADGFTPAIAGGWATTP